MYNIYFHAMRQALNAMDNWRHVCRWNSWPEPRRINARQAWKKRGKTKRRKR